MADPIPLLASQVKLLHDDHAARIAARGPEDLPPDVEARMAARTAVHEQLQVLNPCPPGDHDTQAAHQSALWNLADQHVAAHLGESPPPPPAPLKIASLAGTAHVTGRSQP